jgi:hypothetical protein
MIKDNGLHLCKIANYDLEIIDHGKAVAYCDEEESGKLFASNDEYGNQVNYCPFCGYKAKIQVSYEKH